MPTPILVDKASQLTVAGWDSVVAEHSYEQPLWPAAYSKPTFECAWAFVRKCRTWNEANKTTQPFPDRRYLRELCRLWVRQWQRGKKLFVEKCRRMVVSWLFRCLELWVMGLGRSDWMIVGENYLSASKHTWRLKHLYEDLQSQYPEWNLPPSHGIQHSGERTQKQFTQANKSNCVAINGDAETIQGDGTSGITLEEMGTYRYLKSMLGQASIIVKGDSDSGGTNGFVVGVTNATAKSEWQQIKLRFTQPDSNAPTGTWSRPMDGFLMIEDANGDVYCKVEDFADPSKDDDWLEEVRLEMIDTPRDFKREILMDDTIHEGDPVWEEYSSRVHEYKGDPKVAADCPGIFFAGWDCGSSRMPAFVLALWTGRSRQIRWLMEVVPDRAMAMETFAPLVRTRLKAFLPGLWGEIQHVGDETVRQMGGNVEKSAGMIAKEHGFSIEPISNNIDAREKAVIRFLTDFCDGEATDAQGQIVKPTKPRMLYCTKGCPVLVDGMRGAYQTRLRATGDASGPGIEILEPSKNFYSHVNDAHQYVCVKIERLMTRSTKRRKRNNGGYDDD